MHGMTQPFFDSTSMNHLAKPLAAWGRRCAATATCFSPEERERLAETLAVARLMLTARRPIAAVQEGNGAVRTVAVHVERVQFLPPRAAIERTAPTLRSRGQT